MRIRTIKGPALVATGALLLAACGDAEGDGDGAEAADGAGGSVTLYTHNDEDEMQDMVAAAEEATGLDIEYFRASSGELMSRIQSEAPDVGADMVWGLTHSSTLQAVDQDLVQGHDAEAWGEVPDEFKDTDEGWYGWSYWYNMIGVNTELADELDLDPIESWEDLLDPQYEGEIVMPDPRSSTTAYLIISSLRQIYGEEETWDYLEQLDANVGEYDQSGSGPAEKVARGEYAVAITWDQAVLDRVDEGFPIEPVIPEEGVGFDLDLAWIFEGAENQQAAETLLDWIGSEEGMQAAAEQRDLVTHPAVGDDDTDDANFIDYDAQTAADDENEVLDEWIERFGN